MSELLLAIDIKNCFFAFILVKTRTYMMWSKNISYREEMAINIYTSIKLLWFFKIFLRRNIKIKKNAWFLYIFFKRNKNIIFSKYFKGTFQKFKKKRRTLHNLLYIYFYIYMCEYFRKGVKIFLVFK